jgi:hypothetical protein
MQIRERGRQVVLLRAWYDPESKRTRQVTVAAMDRAAPSMAQLHRADLTDDERAQVAAWLAERQAAALGDRRRRALADLPRVLCDAAEEIEGTHNIRLPEPQRVAIRAGLEALRRVSSTYSLGLFERPKKG